MMKLLRKLQVNKSGASAAEYALILAVIGGGIVTGATLLKTSISSAMSTSATKIDTGVAGS